MFQTCSHQGLRDSPLWQKRWLYARGQKVRAILLPVFWMNVWVLKSLFGVFSSLSLKMRSNAHRTSLPRRVKDVNCCDNMNLSVRACRCYLLPYLVLYAHGPHGNTQLISESSSIVGGEGPHWQRGTAEPIKALHYLHKHSIQWLWVCTTKERCYSKHVITQICCIFNVLIPCLSKLWSSSTFFILCFRLLWQLFMAVSLRHVTVYMRHTYNTFAKRMYGYISLILTHRDSYFSWALIVSCFLPTYRQWLPFISLAHTFFSG